jgi:3-isopropylmalate dehydrogenase
MRYLLPRLSAWRARAFEAAIGRRKVTSADKANVLETSQLWRKTVTRIAADYPTVSLDHLYADAAAMHIITNPGGSMILTENLFGDILSDEAAVLPGRWECWRPERSVAQLILRAGARIGPDIAGKYRESSGRHCVSAMLLRHTAKLEDEALRLKLPSRVFSPVVIVLAILLTASWDSCFHYRDGAIRYRSDRRICRYALCVSCCLVSCQ